MLVSRPSGCVTYAYAVLLSAACSPPTTTTTTSERRRRRRLLCWRALARLERGSSSFLPSFRQAEARPFYALRKRRGKGSIVAYRPHPHTRPRANERAVVSLSPSLILAPLSPLGGVGRRNRRRRRAEANGRTDGHREKVTDAFLAWDSGRGGGRGAEDGGGLESR